MKTLQIPKINIDRSASVCDKVRQVCNSGVRAEINVVNWPVEYPKKMPVSVTVAHDGDNLYLYYEVKRDKIRAVNTRDFGSVWEDSCVEFFMQRQGDKEYRNFECNPLGSLLAVKRESRQENVQQLKSDMPSIIRQTSIFHYYDDGKELSDWILYLEIPKKTLGFADDETLSGQDVRANFYKCGDNTTEPHFLSWNPIETPKPDFHVPRFFGLLKFD